jgi:hypothetical protein
MEQQSPYGVPRQVFPAKSGPQRLSVEGFDELVGTAGLEVDDIPIEASTIVVVYVTFKTYSTVVVKMTVLPGPHGSGV